MNVTGGQPLEPDYDWISLKKSYRSPIVFGAFVYIHTY